MNNMNEELLKLVQQQVTNELNNARLYLAMSNWFNLNGYPNLAKLYRKHYEEELDHQLKLVDFLLDRNILPETRPAEDQPEEYKCVMDILKATLKREQETTAEIKDIYFKALQVKDPHVLAKMQWFMEEQTQEEEAAFTMIDKLTAVGDDKVGMAFFEEWVSDLL